MTRPMLERFMEKVAVTADPDACWLWTASTSGPQYRTCGYGQIGVTRSRNMKAHRYSYQLAYGDLGPDDHVGHRCDNPRCVRPSHLFKCSHADNMKDAALKHRVSRKLTVENVLYIRDNPDRLSQTALANKFGVGQSTISRIVLNHVYRHLRTNHERVK